jgi:predicted Zn-dependent protease
MLMTGIYSYNGNDQNAEISLEKNRLAISIKDEYGQPRSVYWYYDAIEKEGYNAFAHTGSPKQVLRPQSSETYGLILQKLEKRKRPGRSFKAAAFLKVLLVLIILAVLFYFYGVPWLAGKMANRFPIEYEKKLGAQMYNAIKGSFQIDEKRTAYVNDFFRQMNIPSNYDIQITVVKSDVANAFAMPGGHIVIYDKVLNGMSSYEELAALLSHEFTHIENRHSLRSIFRQYSSQIFLSLLFGNLDAASSVLVGNADGLKGLSYSRSLETEADENGAALLAQRKIDCQGFVRLFQLLKKETAGAHTPELINSHPNLDNRITHIGELESCRKNVPVRDTALHGAFLRIQTADNVNGQW